MLCSQGFDVKNYDFTPGCLAYESLRLVQDPGNDSAMKWHDVLKESSSPDSFRGNYLCVLALLNPLEEGCRRQHLTG